MKKIFLATIATLFGLVGIAQTYSTIDSNSLNMDAVYNRPFLLGSNNSATLGGYAEANWQHIGTDGVSDGHQFQMRRKTLFVSSAVNRNIKFLTELEIEEGGKEIAIEFASVDVGFHPLLNLRTGIIMNPIGAFNQNHDGPKWEFTDRPVSATQMLPATWSNAGVGLFGKMYEKDWMFGYEFYLSGGFDNSIIDNTENKTYLPAAKENHDRFEESASGTPLVTGKIAVKNQKIGEIGLSYMGGIYNTFQADGIPLDEKRRLAVFAIDYNLEVPGFQTKLIGEWAWVAVDVPTTYIQSYGNRQQGGFIDIVQPILEKPMFGWRDASVNLACRLEYVDWNVGIFESTQTNIGDELWSLMPAISFRPSSETVIRWNYRIQRHRDVLDNDPAKTGGFSVGLSTYF